MTQEQKDFTKMLETGKMSFPKAMIIASNIKIANGLELTDQHLIKIGEAIKMILDAPSINSINKNELRDIIRFMWDYVYEVEE